MATEEQIERLRQRAQGLGLNPKRPAINKLAAAVDSAVGGTKIPLSGRGRTNAAILTDIASKLESMRQGADLASPGLTAVGSPSEDSGSDEDSGSSGDDDEFEDPLAQTPSSAPTEVGIPEGTPPAGWGGAVWNAAKGAAGLLGVPGATTDVVDAQREHQTEELDWQLHTGDEGYTTDIPIQNENIHTGNLRAWSAGVARAVDAQEASPETQVAIVGAAIEAVSRFRMSASPSPHEAAAVTKLLGALSASRDSPLKQAVLARIDGASPVKLAEFDQARVSLKQTLASESPGGASPARNLNTSFSSVVGNIAPGGQMQAQPGGRQVPNPPAVAPPQGVAVGRQQAVRTQRAIRDTTAAVQAGTATVAAAIADAAQRDELTAAQIVEVQDNLQDAPLTAQLVAQGRVKLNQVLDPAEVASYETALRDRRVKLDSDGRETVERGARLAAQPVLTRYVADPDTGGKRYRRPRFAGPEY
jgi:hypothetical protein